MYSVNATATTSSPVDDRNIVFQALKGGALALLVLWTIAANSLVFIVLYKNPRLQTVPNLLVGNLAFSDLCLGFIVLPLSSVYVIAGQWVFPGVLCEIFVSADILCCTASIWGLSVVGLDRYWAITSPVAYMAKRTKRTAVIMIVGVWILASLISLAPLLGWKQAAPRSNYYVLNDTAHCAFLDLPSYTVYSATGSFFTPTLVMFFVYVKIYQAFAKHRARQIYRQKVIRKHIESTILHEISHVLPTSDEFAKEEEEDDDDDEEDEDEQSDSSERKNGPIIEVDEDVCLGDGDGDGDGVDGGRLGGSSQTSTSGRTEASTSNNNDEHSSTAQEEMATRRKHKLKQLDRMNKNFVKTVGFSGSMRSEPFSAEGSKQNSLRSTKRSLLKSNLTFEKVQRHKNRKERRPMYRKSLQRKPKAISAAKERRGVKVLGIILGCFTICWTPFFVMYLVIQFCPSGCSINPHIEMFITWLGYSNSAMNPIIYTVFNRDYQIALKRLFSGDTRPVSRRAL